jgi:AcrR family transcriptional regulator
MSRAQAPDEKSRAAALLGAGRSTQEVADELGCSRVTIWRWTQDPVFEALREDVRRRIADEFVTSEVAELRLLATPARAALAQALTATLDGIPDHRVRIAAAKQVFDRIAEFRPGMEVELGVSEQLAALIRSLDDDDGPGAGAPDAPSS